MDGAREGVSSINFCEFRVLRSLGSTFEAASRHFIGGRREIRTSWAQLLRFGDVLMVLQ